MQRRNFIRDTAQASIALSVLGWASCKQNTKKSINIVQEPDHDIKTAPFFTLSLAQWSIHKMILEDGMDPFEFAAKAKGWGFKGLEYVNHLYASALEKNTSIAVSIDHLVKELNKRSEAQGLENLIIMIDGEGDLGTANTSERTKAIENHYKWVDAAAGLGCHSIRVNLFGEDTPDIWKSASVDALGKLSEYGNQNGINILVENHGWLSSNAKLLAEIIQEVNMSNCGTLPDFGNFCLKRENGERWGASCIEEYDKYQGVRELMPFAKAVSAKSYDFDNNGNETTIDYVRMLQIVKDAGYSGFIGVEYEGSRLSEEEGITATRDLLLKASEKLN
ncbi:sugar phosphate isomerase/epimerase family protein [Ascidiimonas aurantiaca]|uniref:sugar phosphate isomerase/epimerase family protein n=1 Tax=Ascidiimonas aurantiaca TaxID=1685432 RepID=UPI0030ECDB1C